MLRGLTHQQEACAWSAYRVTLEHLVVPLTRYAHIDTDYVRTISVKIAGCGCRVASGLDYEAQQLSLFCLTEASSFSDVIGSGTETTIGMGIQTTNPAASICIIQSQKVLLKACKCDWVHR